jgi:hypothetical protein
MRTTGLSKEVLRYSSERLTLAACRPRAFCVFTAEQRAAFVRRRGSLVLDRLQPPRAAQYEGSDPTRSGQWRAEWRIGGLQQHHRVARLIDRARRNCASARPPADWAFTKRCAITTFGDHLAGLVICRITRGGLEAVQQELARQCVKGYRPACVEPRNADH